MRNFATLVGIVQSYQERNIRGNTLGKLTLRLPGRRRKDGSFHDPSFIDVDIWGIDEYLSGKLDKWSQSNQRVRVVGKIQQQRWKSKEGHERSKLVLVANAEDVSYFPSENSPSRANRPAQNTAPVSNNEGAEESETDSDIPF